MGRSRSSHCRVGPVLPSIGQAREAPISGAIAPGPVSRLCRLGSWSATLFQVELTASSNCKGVTTCYAYSL